MVFSGLAPPNLYRNNHTTTTGMNVGSILNGDLPPDDKKQAAAEYSSPQQPQPPDLHHRHSINDLLNDPPGKAKAKAAKSALPGAEERDVVSDDFSLADDDDDKSVTESETPAKTLHTADDRSSSIISSELERLTKLKGKKGKPHRYTEPPVWATQWVPPAQRNQEYPETAPNPASAAGAYDISAKPVFDRSTMHSVDLECLITGVIPPQATVRTIAEWLYANFVEILLEDRQRVELELKFGTLVSKETGSRIDIGVSTECIYTKAASFRFEAGVHEVGWEGMKLFLEELEKAYQVEAKKDPSKPRRKFSTTESHDTDYFFQITERNEKPKKIRISKDLQLTPPRLTGIEKERLSDLYIHNPSSMYDLRLSLLIEHPVNELSLEPIMKKNKPTLQRGKKRVSYTHAPTVTRFDFTEVLVPKTMKNKAGKTMVENEKSLELELEIDTFQIFRGFDRIRDGSDSIRFEELVEIFLNNARCLNNRVTKLASE